MQKSSKQRSAAVPDDDDDDGGDGDEHAGGGSSFDLMMRERVLQKRGGTVPAAGGSSSTGTKAALSSQPTTELEYVLMEYVHTDVQQANAARALCIAEVRLTRSSRSCWRCGDGGERRQRNSSESCTVSACCRGSGCWCICA